MSTPLDPHDECFYSSIWCPLPSPLPEHDSDFVVQFSGHELHRLKTVPHKQDNPKNTWWSIPFDLRASKVAPVWLLLLCLPMWALNLAWPEPRTCEWMPQPAVLNTTYAVDNYITQVYPLSSPNDGSTSTTKTVVLDEQLLIDMFGCSPPSNTDGLPKMKAIWRSMLLGGVAS